MEHEVTSEKQVNSKPARDENGRLLPGHTANPNGRPKGTRSLTTLVREALKQMGADGATPLEDLLAKRVIKKAIDEGDMQAIKLIWNYLDGLPEQKLIGDSEQPIAITISQAAATKYGITPSTGNDTERPA